MKRCDGCGRVAGPSARSHRHRLICPVCLSILFNLELIKRYCPRDHEFTEENTLTTKPGYWQCRTCHRDDTRDRERLKRERAAEQAKIT